MNVFVRGRVYAYLFSSLMRDLNWTPAGSVVRIALFPRVSSGAIGIQPLAGVDICSVGNIGVR